MSIQAKPTMKGFSIIEMLIALTIIASIVTIAAISIRPTSGPAAVRIEAREVAAGLRRVRAHAIANGENTDFYVNLRHREYDVLEKRRTLHRDIDINATVADSFTDEDGTIGIRFYPNGASSGGALSFVSGAAQSTVDVDWMTGRISIENEKIDL